MRTPGLDFLGGRQTLEGRLCGGALGKEAGMDNGRNCAVVPTKAVTKPQSTLDPGWPFRIV